MSYQYVIDNAASISILRRPVVGQTISRNFTVRTVSRGNNLWNFQVTLPTGPRWTDNRRNITEIEQLERIQDDYIQFNNPGHNWLVKYLGDQANPTNIQVTLPSSGNIVTIASGVTITSGFVFRKGDFIQLGDLGNVYNVVNDVAWNQTQIELHRPLVNETVGTRTLRVAADCRWRVRCVAFPRWTLFARDQIEWDGAFTFQEVLV